MELGIFTVKYSGSRKICVDWRLAKDGAALAFSDGKNQVIYLDYTQREKSENLASTIKQLIMACLYV